MRGRKLEACELRAMVDAIGDPAYRQLQHDHLTDISKTQELKTWGPRIQAVDTDPEVCSEPNGQDGQKALIPEQVGRMSCADSVGVYEVAS